MADKKPVTKKDLLDTLHDFWTEVAFPQVQEMINEVRKELKDTRNELKTGQKNLQRQLSDLKSDTPTRKEFQDLKERVDRYHSAN